MPELAGNKRLLYDYEILEKWEAGLKLTGGEVKSVKKGQISLKGAYVTIKNNTKSLKPEAWLVGANITRYPKSRLSWLKARKNLINAKRSKSVILKEEKESWSKGN